MLTILLKAVLVVILAPVAMAVTRLAMEIALGVLRGWDERGE
jgi:hypothetical protein